jgi:hypothetical protein
MEDEAGGLPWSTICMSSPGLCSSSFECVASAIACCALGLTKEPKSEDEIVISKLPQDEQSPRAIPAFANKPEDINRFFLDLDLRIQGSPRSYYYQDSQVTLFVTHIDGWCGAALNDALQADAPEDVQINRTLAACKAWLKTQFPDSQAIIGYEKKARELSSGNHRPRLC